ncbi:hypothetical protein LCL61_16070 [Amycolatopsis coloradensis]|uniref:Uncharacterized protein n=1 Tax=Amycolatopsis coloradensis TaxID=76021 RepID=A0ACD5BCD2_9PSEU
MGSRSCAGWWTLLSGAISLAEGELWLADQVGDVAVPQFLAAGVV